MRGFERCLMSLRKLSPLICLTVALASCGWLSPNADGLDRLERNFAAVRSEYRQRLDAADTTAEIIEAASFGWGGWSMLEDLLSWVAAMRTAAGECALVVEQETAALKSKALDDGEKDPAQFESGSMAAYVGGLAATEEVAVALSEMLA